jgi:plasmid stabilization system protein ParE
MASAADLRERIPGYPDESERILFDPGEVARFHDRCSDLMRELLDDLAEHPEEPRPFPEIEDGIGWPRRRIASVLGGVWRLRHHEFAGARPYHFNAPRHAGSGRWEIWMDARQAAAVRAACR